MENRVKILLVEDDEVDRMAFERFVEREGLPYDCVIAGSVAAAREALVDAQFDAVLLDYMLGEDTALDLLEETEDLVGLTAAAVVVITGSGDEEIAVRAMKAGAYDYLVKDVEGNYLTALPVVVENAVHRKRAEEELERYREQLEGLVKERTAELHQINKELEHDITKRRQAQEALREAEEKYRNLFTDAQVALFRTRISDGALIEINKRYAEMAGYSSIDECTADFHPGKSWANPEMRIEMIQILQEKGAVKNYETEIIRGDGKHIWIIFSATIYPEKGYIEGSIEDITERKQAQDALRESEEKYRTILENIEDGYYEVDLVGNLTFFNDSLCEMLGYSTDELMGMNNREFMDDETAKAVYQTFNQVYRTGKPAQAVDWELIRKDKDKRIIEASVSLMSDSAGEPTGFRGIARDITERVRSEEERMRMEQQLHQQERLAAVGQLAGGIAHDFNNMLTVVSLYSHQILRQESPSAGTVSAAKTIIAEPNNASKLVGQILDFSRRSSFETKPIYLKPFVKEIVRILKRTIPESIHLQFDTGPEEAPPFAVEADPARIQQVLMNLATNARDAMPEGGELRIDLSRLEIAPDATPPAAGMPPGEWIRLSVSDTGTGIPSHVLDHIFEPFFTTKGRGEGTGLGLAQVDGIVAQHGGYIGVETEVGADCGQSRGTTFHIYLPACKAQDIIVEEETTAPPRGHGETILLVEDNEALRKAGQEILKSLGYRVLSVANGHEALEAYRAIKGIALVITDLVMPKMGGKELVRELRKTTAGVKALVISGYAMQEDLEELKEDGFLEIVHKPFEVEDLARVVRHALDEK